MRRQLTVFIALTLFFINCKDNKEPFQISHTPEGKHSEPIVEPEYVIDYDTSLWTEITEETGVILDIRYATENNFTKEQIYPCDRCFLRPEMAKKILQLQKDIAKRYNLTLKLFDCYRPRPAQQKLWDIVPDPRYVTKPERGSMHNRGLAVDITLADMDGQELDMGTDYDHFGWEAYTTNKDLPKEILKNRNILSSLMKIHGMTGIRTEWWHYSLKTVKSPFDDWQWPCED